MRKVVWSIALAFTLAAASAQVTSPTPVPYTPKKLDEYTAYCALWRTDATFRSTVRLTNSLETSPIDATVTLYMADGTPYVLPTVHLAKSGVDTVDINAALAQAPPAIQSHLSTFGSASVQYRHDWKGVVLPTMSILDVPRSLGYAPLFVFPKKPAPSGTNSAPPPQFYEGLWWRQSAASAGFVALANTTDNPIGVEVTVSGLNSPAGSSLTLGAHSTTMVDLKGFFAGDGALVGGVRIDYTGAWGSVHAAGGLEDAVKGFSADLPLKSQPAASETPGPRQLACAGLMVNTQDPLLNFPASVSFTPYAFFRNVSATSRTLHSVVYYMDGRTVKSLPLADLTLQPGGASALPIGNLMQSQTQIEGINLSYSYDGTWGDILAGVGSVDQTGNYVFPVAPERVYKGGARGSAYWLAAGGFDTMYTLWNPTPDAQDFLVTLRYGTNGDSYKLPVTLEPYASTMIDIGELIRTQQLDQAGRILPAAVTQGSLLVSSPANDPKDAIEVVLSGGIYNPTKATCSLPCQTCQGLTNIECNPTSVTVPVGGQDPVTFGYTYSNGNYYSLASSATWTSSAPTVLTVGGGVVTGVSPGGAEWQGNDPNPIAVYTLQFCSDSMCPTTEIGSCGGTATVCGFTIGSPANGQVFSLGGGNYNQATIPLNATSACSGSASWQFNWSYTLINGSGSYGSTTSTSTNTQQSQSQNTNYTPPAGSGGQASVSVSATLGGAPLSQSLTAYVDGTTIPNATLVSGLTSLYNGGATSTLLVGIAFSESSCRQFASAYNGTYQIQGAWPLESTGGGYVGLMQVQTVSQATLFDWTANAQSGYSIFQGWLSSASSYSQKENAQYPQLPLLSATQLENEALWLYAGYGGSGHYYLPNSNGTGWVVTSASQGGVNYVASVRAHASLNCS